jgi:hypothetical protein
VCELKDSNQYFQGCDCMKWKVFKLIKGVYAEIRSIWTIMEILKILIKNPNF